ncbi:MAG: glycosyltransferase family 4 protein [Limisphaerales bacterium]
MRKFNPAEWGGTETALQRLFEGLREHQVRSLAYCPRIPNGAADDPLLKTGCTVKRFNSCVPIWGISRQRKDQMIAVGGNLMSFGLIRDLWREPEVSVIHSHTLGRIGGIALSVAKQRRVPFVVTIHGGALDLPPELRNGFKTPDTRGWEWGRMFGFLLQSRRLFVDADAIIACNSKEAGLLRERHPEKLILVQAHGVPVDRYRRDCREAARAAFPQIRDRPMLLAVGRIDPVKNQGWLIEQAAEVLRRHPQVLVVLAGACTHATYGAAVETAVRHRGLESHVLFTGGLPPEDPRLIGLLQEAAAVVLPSLSETFGLVILEAWAAGTTVIANRTSGAAALIQHGQNGWLFDLPDPSAFHEAVHVALRQPELAAQFGANGARRVANEFDTQALAGRLKGLYEQLIEAKHALRHSPRRRH